VWNNAKGKAVSIQFPRYGLEFIDRGKGLQMEELPGFVLQSGSPRFMNIAPPLVLKKREQKRFLFLNPLYLGFKVFEESGRRYFQFEERGRKLHPITPIDRLYLCTIELQQQEYDRALDLLASE